MGLLPVAIRCATGAELAYPDREGLNIQVYLMFTPAPKSENDKPRFHTVRSAALVADFIALGQL